MAYVRDDSPHNLESEDFAVKALGGVGNRLDQIKTGFAITNAPQAGSPFGLSSPEEAKQAFIDFCRKLKKENKVFFFSREGAEPLVRGLLEKQDLLRSWRWMYLDTSGEWMEAYLDLCMNFIEKHNLGGLSQGIEGEGKLDDAGKMGRQLTYLMRGKVNDDVESHMLQLFYSLHRDYKIPPLTTYGETNE